MKQFLIDYALNVVVAIVVLVLGNIAIQQAASLYYKYAPLERFYVNTSFFASDTCVGSTSHIVVSDRQVLNTETGYAARVNKELYKLDSGQKIKVFDEQKTPFVEVTRDPIQREQYLPPSLETGFYMWTLYISLDINGADREVIPPVDSNIFEIKDCK